MNVGKTHIASSSIIMKAILSAVAAVAVLSLASCASHKKEECTSCTAPVSAKAPVKVTKHKH